MAVSLNDTSLLKTGAYINGQWVASNSGDTLDVTNPATGEVIARVASCGTAETRRAIEAAEAAQLEWRQKSIKERAVILRKWFNLMMESQEDLAQILTAEQGKPLAEARGEILYGAAFFEWFAEEAKRIYGDTIPQPSNDKRIICIKQPVGVVACVTSYNFPMVNMAGKIGPALAMGNGIYKSLDGGESWTHMGLAGTHTIPRIVVPMALSLKMMSPAWHLSQSPVSATPKASDPS